jgi:hypothetical protein
MSTTQLDYYFSVIVTSKDLPQEGPCGEP